MTRRSSRTEIEGSAKAGSSEQEYLRLSRQLRELARRLVDDESSADDVVQEAWLAALDQPERVRDLNAWLARVVRNLSARAHRRKLRRQDVEILAAERDMAASDGDLLERVSAYNSLRRNVEGLREPFRTALELRFFEEDSFDAIARELGISTAAARSRVRRGVELLRERLDREHDGQRAAWAGFLVGALGQAPQGRLPVAARALSLAGMAVLAVIAGVVFWPSKPAAEADLPALSRAAPEALGSPAQGMGPAGEPLSSRRSLVTSSNSPPSASPPAPAADSGLRVLEVRVLLEEGRIPQRARVRVRGADGFLATYSSVRGASIRIELALDQLSTDSLLADGQPGLRVVAVADDEVISLESFIGLPAAGRVLELRTRGRSRAVMGRVFDEQGEPIAGARIELLELRAQPVVTEEGSVSAEPALWKATDSSGAYEFRNLPLGELVFLASKPGRSAERSSAGSGEDLVQLDFTLVRGRNVRGVLRGSDGEPLVGARVWAPVVESTERSVVSETRTDEQGSFILRGFEAGWHHIFAHAADDPELFASGVVEVPAEESGRWDATLRFTAGVHVLIEEADGSPLPTAHVILISEVGSQGWGAVAEADDEGHAHVLHVPAGELTLIARRFGSDQEQSVVEGVRRDTGDILVQLEDLTRSGAIVGLIPAELAEQLTEVRVFGERGRERLVQTRPDEANSRFELGRLAPGRYAAWIVVPYRGVLALGMLEVGAVPLELGPIATPQAVVVELDWSGSPPSAEQPWALEAIIDSVFKPACGIGTISHPASQLMLYPGVYALKLLDAQTEPCMFRVEGERTRVVIGG